MAQGDKAQFETNSDQTGEFRFSNLPFGTYELEMFVFGNSFKQRINVRASGKKNDKVEIKAVIVTEACSGEPEIPSRLITDNDKAEIVRQMLDEYVDAWVRGEQAEKLILSTDNIDPKWIDNKNKAKLQLMRQSDVQHLADTTKDFTYLRLFQLKVRGECVAVSLDNSWAVGKNSPYGYVSGEGKTHEFRKVNGRWIGKFVIGWIS
jgi:hypothetical protein